MPEGDTILRTAQTMDRWLAGRVITRAQSAVPRVPADVLVGRTVLAVEARAKHLLVRFGPGDGSGLLGGELTLRSHQRMGGSWYVTTNDTPWRRPAWQAQLVLEAGERLAICFKAPVVELFPTRETAVHPVLRGLGPDVLAGPIPAGTVWSRATSLLEPDAPVGELLLDQRVVSGIGNIWRSESLFVCRVDPWARWPTVGTDALDRLAATAGELMGARVPTTSGAGAVPRPTPIGAPGGGRRWVYGRHGRPCWRCRTVIRCGRLGRQARTVWWCPTCQPPVASPGSPGPGTRA